MAPRRHRSSPRRRWHQVVARRAGTDQTLMSGAQLFMREDVGLTDVQIEVLAGSMNVFMLVSILAGGWFADRLGRRSTLVLANGFLMAGALATSLGGSFASLMAARFVTSVGAGFARVVAPVYNAEISPPSSRGVLSSLLDIFINLGILLSYVSNYAFAGLPVGLGWRVMYGAGAVPPVFIAAGVFFMPESPRWLAMRGRHDDARAVLVRTSDTPAEADLRLSEVKQAVAPRQHEHAGAGGVWKELVLRPRASVRRILTCVVGLHYLRQVSGIDAILLYSPLVFRHAGMSSNAAAVGATVGISAVKTCFILVGMLLTDRLGRRPLLLFSTAGVAASYHSLPRHDAPPRRRRGLAAGCKRSGCARRGGSVLGRVRVGGERLQRGDPAAAAPGAGGEHRRGGQQAHVWACRDDVHLARRRYRHARVLLLVRWCDGGGVCVRVCAAAGDQGEKPRGHGSALR
ncbi:unnamed protein product [Urochloa humidicola]